MYPLIWPLPLSQVFVCEARIQPGCLSEGEDEAADEEGALTEEEAAALTEEEAALTEGEEASTEEEEAALAEAEGLDVEVDEGALTGNRTMAPPSMWSVRAASSPASMQTVRSSCCVLKVIRGGHVLSVVPGWHNGVTRV